MDISVGIFKNIENSDIILVPFGIDESGVSRGLKQHEIVSSDPADIGSRLRKCFGMIENKEYTPDDMKDVDIKRITGDKSEKTFTKRNLFQTVFLVKQKGFEFEPKTRNTQNNGYTGKGEVSEELKLNVSDDELGKAVLRTFEKCR
ncbi:hypothetical protein [Rossellomorea sp. FM04394]|uniref:hypothetical protein n=1 Tax=Rossellomorea sp. FM04394 TaxID=3243076 RepID=UPI0035A5A5F5